MATTSGAPRKAERPFFRYDLHTEVAEEGGKRFVDVKDPESGNSFRFYEVEYAVACGMDGERDILALVDWAKDELALETSPAEVGAIVDKLDELRYLESSRGRSSTAPAPIPPSLEIEADEPDDDISDEERAAALELSADFDGEEAPTKIAQPAPELVEATVDDGTDEVVELGRSGKSPMPHERPARPTEPGNVELGHAGASDVPRDRSQRPTDQVDFELGAAGGSDDFQTPSKRLSTDLSQTFRLDPQDVKEAVRASKVMSVVDMPEDLSEEIAELEAADEAAATAPVATPPPPLPIEVVDAEGAEPDIDLTEQIAEDAAATESGADAIVLPDGPKTVEPPQPVVAVEANEQAAKSSATMVVLLLLLLVVAGGGAYYYWEFVREKPAASEGSSKVEPAPKEVEPVKPEPPKAVLKVVEGPSSELTSDKAGAVAWVAAPGTEVKEGDAIVKLNGFQKYEARITEATESQANYQRRLDDAKAKGDQGKVDTMQANVDRKQRDIERETAKRDEFILTSSNEGVVEPLVEEGGRVKAGDVVAKVSGASTSSASFTLPEGITAAVGDRMKVVSTEDSELRATCEVTAAEGQQVTLGCPADSGFTTEATIQLDI